LQSINIRAPVNYRELLFNVGAFMLLLGENKMNPQKAKEMQRNEIVTALNEALTRARDLITKSCFDCIDILVQVGKFNEIELKIAIGMAADALVKKLLPELVGRL